MFKIKGNFTIYLVIFVFTFCIFTYEMFLSVAAKELEGKVSKVSGDIIDINLGSNDGLTEGTEGIVRLKITANGQPVTLDIARIKVTKVTENTCKAKITKKTTNVQAGYIVVFSNIEIAVATPKPTNTPVPLPTNTPVPLPTNTPVPLPTDTPMPLDTPIVVPTSTPEPLPTSTPEPLPTSTPEPLPTNTPSIVLPTETPVSVAVMKTIVEVKTDPTRARVYLEGALIGRTPLKLTDLVPGTYLMVVTIDDLMWEEQVTIKAGENLLEPKFKRIPYQGMIYVPGGDFIVGSNEPGSPDGPETKVYLEAYYIDRCEVTMAEYANFVKSTGYKSQGSWDMYFKKGYENYPVVNVSWNDAKSYAEWVGKRLPNELEWEKAARGTDGRIWPWGNQWDKNKCNNTTTNDTSIVSLMLNMGEGKGPVPVGIIEKGMSPYGAMDMAGNVEEWISDWYQPYPYEGPYQSGMVKTIRGGSWYHYEGYTKCSSRNKFSPDKGYNKLGFRCVKDL
ncbi:MAG TPA: SUMF1/EgtB/PvdO family nonheme iron enzyme [Candidatus Eremiobacteraeota bacterium]|nr:MAG: Serine/threonine-protein kinase pkn1 [bacterium ADurb.Bin363]HPZ06547.1 SUMF1/EgtB/PvdO family nonheme iron enzyme [Candidatus Eremiobacteraeota bacterium]